MEKEPSQTSCLLNNRSQWHERPRVNRQAITLLALLGLSLIVRLGCAALVLETPLVGDEHDYYTRAIKWLEGNPKNDGFRAPLFQYVVAALIAIFGKATATVRMAAAALSSLIVVPVFLAGTRLASPRVGAVAGALAAAYPPLVAYSHYLWTEAIYTTAAMATLLLTEKMLLRKEFKVAALAGLCWAALILTREVALAAFTTVLAWSLWQKRLRLGQLYTTAFLLAAALPVAAWSLQLNAQHAPGENYALVAHSTYLNLYIGNGPTQEIRKSKPWLSPRKHYESLARSRSQRETLAKPLVLQSIREAGLAWLPHKLQQMVPRFFCPGGFPVRRLLITAKDTHTPWGYRDSRGRLVDPEISLRIAKTYVAFVSAVLVLGIAGWIALGVRSHYPLYGLFTSFAVGHFWPTIIAFATTRFRLPVMPLFLIGGAYLLSNPLAAWRFASKYRICAMCAASLAMLWLVHSEYKHALTAAWQ